MNGSACLLLGDVLEQLADIPSESVHCCVTSPPYWGLRDYGVPGQLGLEPTPQEHIAAMVGVMREVRRVLRKDGTLWLNYGDCYATAPNGRSADDTKTAGNDDRTFRDKPFSTVTARKAFTEESGPVPTSVRKQGPGFKPKDLCMMPHRLAIALQDDGWWVRCDIVWAKPNPMPESIEDRPTKSHEYLFLLAKSPTYFYDATAIREKSSTKEVTVPAGWATEGDHTAVAMEKTEQGSNGRNKRSVWTVATHAYPDAHFATFPPDLIRPCILAGTSEKGVCGACGAPWRRVTDKERGYSAVRPSSDKAATRSEGNGYYRPNSKETGGVAARLVTQTTGWQPSCKCEASDPVPATVLDPFFGSGTTGAVSLEYGRNIIGIELNPEYLRLAEKRIAPFLAQGRLTL